MKESVFQKQVIDFLKSEGAYVIKYWAGSAFTKEGVPDILACINGYFHGIELKTDIGIESKLQAYNMDGIINSGGQSYVLRPTKLKGQKYPEYKYKEYTFEQWKVIFFKK